MKLRYFKKRSRKGFNYYRFGEQSIKSGSPKFTSLSKHYGGIVFLEARNKYPDKIIIYFYIISWKTILDWTVLDTGEIDGDDGCQSTLSELPFQYAVMSLFSCNGTLVSSTPNVHNW